ncbi:hypothetical protein LOD99_11864 [Oopsacas minuta]|uniref:Uncharacterized protein n=1 Tax=Oopsacas minuta TaxID=111878 RepID=A0AAV7JKX3_9METZ|nr:hypothetical protein LOD99_11864 [Oopsacas minuta]
MCLVAFSDFYGVRNTIGPEIEVLKTQLQEQCEVMVQENDSPLGLLDMLQFLRPYCEAYRRNSACHICYKQAVLQLPQVYQNVYPFHYGGWNLGDLGCLYLNREMAVRLNMA